MSIQPQYKDYNEVIVTICNDYVISNVSTKGILSPNSSTHLSSITINPPGASTDASQTNCSSGTVILFDYYSEVFKRLESYRKANNEATVPITITIKCYTGNYTYNGTVIKWSFSFTGSVPTISLEWNVVSTAPSSSQVKNLKLDINKLYGNFKSVNAFVNNAQNILKDCFSEGNMPKIVYNDNGVMQTDLDKYIMFPLKDDEVLHIDADSLGKTKNVLINCYICVANSTVSKSLKLKDSNGQDTDFLCPIHGEIVDIDDNQFILSPKSPQSVSYKTDESESTEQLIFVQNGGIAAYNTFKFQQKDKIAIPMMSFSTNIDSGNSSLLSDVWFNINGSKRTSGDSHIENSTIQQVELSDSQTMKSENVTVEFECYNVMSFVRNNVGSKIQYIVFDENGNEHPLSVNNNYLTVQEVSYELSGAVVKAKIKATKAFNSVNITTTNNVTSSEIGEITKKDADNTETDNSES